MEWRLRKRKVKDGIIISLEHETNENEWPRLHEKRRVIVQSSIALDENEQLDSLHRVIAQSTKSWDERPTSASEICIVCANRIAYNTNWINTVCKYMNRRRKSDVQIVNLAERNLQLLLLL